MNITRHFHMTVLALMLALLPLGLLAEPVGRTLEVQLSAEVADPEQPQFIDELSSFAGAPLRYVKAVSGDEHLFQLAKPLPDRQLRKVVARLERHQYVRQVTLER